jgi:hypothetical protein
MFPALLCPSSGARDNNVDYHIGRFVLGCCRLEDGCVKPGKVSGLKALACSPNETTNVVINITVMSS